MAKESSGVKNVQILACTSTECHAHCWHFEKHEHSFDRCCFCHKTGIDIFGNGFGGTKNVEAPATK